MAILSMSGEVASAKNTFSLLHWLLSWFVDLKPAQVNMVNYVFRETGHVLSYGVMYFLWFRAFRGHWGITSGRAFLCALGVCLLVSVTDEGHQSLTQTRGGSGYDVLLDLSGSSLAALITFAVWTPRSKAETLAAPTQQQSARSG
jgi:VanZ family protein